MLDEELSNTYLMQLLPVYWYLLWTYILLETAVLVYSCCLAVVMWCCAVMLMQSCENV